MPVDRGSVQREQNQILLEAFGDRIESDPPDWRAYGEGDTPPSEDPAPRVFFRRRTLVVRSAYAERVSAFLRGDSDVIVQRRRDVSNLPGVVQIVVPGRFETTREALAAIEEEFGTGVASVDHLLSITPPSGSGSRCPATEPDVVPENARPWPPVTSSGPDGTGVRVGIIDTGFFKDAATDHEWLAGVVAEQQDLEDEADANGNIAVYAGHGTFIAGVVRALAPRAEVVVKRFFSLAGGAFETEVAAAIRDLLHDGVDVINLSAGTYAFGGTGTLALRVVIEEELPRHKGVVLVASAGNDSVRDPFYPAAVTGTVSVGALSARGDDRAGFSNHGGWVDVWAPGEDLVNAYAHGCFTYREPPRKGQAQEFAGMCRWSGTSFSAPVVAGLIAARMSATGENGVTAAQRLVDFGQTQAIPGVGAVLRPGDALGGA